MPERPTSAESILAAARSAIAARGPGKLTLTEVAEAAGVSRPTLYRWFPTKADLLASLTAYEVEQFDRGLRDVIGSHAAPERRLDEALTFLVTYLDGTMGSDPVSADPGFALQSLRSLIDGQIQVFARLLGSSLDIVPAVHAGCMSREDAAEMLLRLAYSHFLIPHREPEVMVATMRSIAGVPRRTAAPRRAPKRRD